MAKTFDQLAGETPYRIRDRARKVNLWYLGVDDVEGIGEAFWFGTGSNGQDYISLVHLDENYNAVVSCSCGYFKYNLEYILTQDTASMILYSNGQAPTEMNVGYSKHLCKHLYAIWLYYKDKIYTETEAKYEAEQEEETSQEEPETEETPEIGQEPPEPVTPEQVQPEVQPASNKKKIEIRLKSNRNEG